MLRVLIALVCSAATGVAFVSASQQPQFRSGANTVSVYATVVDRSGRLVPGLMRDDFEVYDNGRRQPLTVFANEVQPITVVIMLDRSGSMVRHFALVRQAAERFVDNLMDGDRARLGSFSNRIQIDPKEFTSDRDELIDILRNNLQKPGTTPLWNATSAAMTALAREPGRRVVLLFTDGLDTPEALRPNSTFEDVRDRSVAENIMVYGIGLSTGCEGSSSGPWVWPGVPRYLEQRRPGGVRMPPIRMPPMGRPPVGRPPAGPFQTMSSSETPAAACPVARAGRPAAPRCAVARDRTRTCGRWPTWAAAGTSS
jgi:hypothetical protein